MTRSFSLGRFRTRRSFAGLALSLFSVLLPLPASAQATKPWRVILSPDNSLQFSIYKGEQRFGTLGMVGWAPNWAFRNLSAKERAQNGVLHATSKFEGVKGAGEVINIQLDAQQSASNAIDFTYSLQSDKDVPLTQLIAYFTTDVSDGEASVSLAGGKTQKLPLSFAGRQPLGLSSAVELNSASLGKVDLAFDPPQPLSTDKQLRVGLAVDKFPAGKIGAKMTLTLPGETAFLASDADLAQLTKVLPGPDWFPFTPTNDLGPSALGFENWLDKPAGQHGGVRLVGDHFQFTDGTPVKFWGTNLCYSANAPKKEDADFTAARLAKWGINAIRMHKFQGVGWAGIGDPNDGTKSTPDGQDRLDYFCSKLTEHGVYYGWSPVFGFEVRPGNKDRLLAYDEIIKADKNGRTYALINLAEDIQDLLIDWTVNELKHKNPYTGKTFAEDPSLAYVELQNEDDIFFYTNSGAFNSCPTYRQKFIERFADWLKAKYGTTDALRQAWGDALAKNETLEAKNIAVQPGPWFYGDQNLPQKQGGERRRLLDNAAFFHDVQNKFYTRFAKAIREAGYQGPIVGSPWQAPSMLPHYYNLKSDAMVGYVDRHNYFDAKLFDSPLTAPGGNLLSTGLQQVAGHPFGVSEWIDVYPALYNVEGPPMMAAYGLGLQGWDASYEFQSRTGTTPFSESVGHPFNGVWNADVPTQVGQYPLLARMIARGDVKEGEVISTRRISPQNLVDGEFNFSDRVQQQGDVKSFGGSVPAKALTIGRCVVDFTDSTQPSQLPDISKYEQNGVLRSTTGQLMWDPAGQGYFTIDTPGTKGVIGFAGGKESKLGAVTVKLNSPYAGLLITASEKGKDLSTGRTALVSLIARNANSGMSYFEPDQKVQDIGKAPIMLEPAKATVTFAGRKVAAVNVLDFDGKRTGRTVPVTDGHVDLDTGQDRAIYYEVVFG